MMTGRMWMAPPKKEEAGDELILYQTGDGSYQNWQVGYMTGGASTPTISSQYLRLHVVARQECAVTTATSYDLTDYNTLQVTLKPLQGDLPSYTNVDISALSGSYYIRIHVPGPCYAIVGTGQMDPASTYTIRAQVGTGTSYDITYVALTKEYPE